MPEPLIIKKYANRRLYDTQQSRYITLPELATMVRAGTDVRVLDAKDGTDLTRAVLMQVLLEEQERLDVLPVELLHHMVRVQGTLQAAPFTRWLTEAFGQWSALSRVVREGLGALTGWPTAGRGAGASAGSTAGSAAAGSAAAGSAAPGSAAPGEAMDDAPSEPTEPAPTPRSTPGAPKTNPMDAVRSQMDELLTRLKSS